MDDFARLPAELHLRVVILLPDLPTLQNLIYVSPTLHATFEQNHIKIANIIMSGLELDLRVEIRTVARALTGHPDPSISTGDEKFEDPTLPSTMSLSACRRFLLVSCRIQRVGDDYLTTQIDRLNFIDAEKFSDEQREFNLYGRQPSEEDPPESAVSIERCRVEYLLWRRQFFVMDARSLNEEMFIMRQDLDQMRRFMMPWDRDPMIALNEYLHREHISMRNTSLDFLEGEFRRN